MRTLLSLHKCIKVVKRLGLGEENIELMMMFSHSLDLWENISH